MYIARERRAYILRLLQQRGSVRSAALAQELGVTDETIRTDLVDMQRQGLLKRVHGGARYVLPLEQPLPAGNARLDCQLAEVAAGHIAAGTRIFLDDSPFAVALVAALHDKPCTLISPSLRVLHQLQAAALPHEILCPGGGLDKESGMLTNAQPEDALRSMGAELAVLSPPALHPHTAGFDTAIRAAWAQAAAGVAARSFVLVPAAALGADAPHRFELKPTLLITEDALPEEFDNEEGTETVPYIAPEDIIRYPGFDY